MHWQQGQMTCEIRGKDKCERAKEKTRKQVREEKP